MEEAGLQITQLLVLVVGIVTSVTMAALKKVSEGLDSLPKPAKTLLVGAIATPIAILSGWVGIDLPGDPTTWDGTTVNVILTWASSMGIRAAARAIVPKQE